MSAASEIFQATQAPRPWSVDRWGRLLAGTAILAMTVLGLLHHGAWMAGPILASLNLIVTSFTDRCVFHYLMVRLGAKEREDLFLPGGAMRPDVSSDRSIILLEDSAMPLIDERSLPISTGLEKKGRRATAISQALRAICDEPREHWPVSGAQGALDYRIKVANNPATRRRAYALAYRVYKQCGYASANERGLCVSGYDARRETLTLLAEDSRGRDAGTASLVFDSPDGLPCDEIYRDQTDTLRATGSQLVEVTRLAVDESGAAPRQLLIRMFNLLYIHARRVMRRTGLLIEVTPSHARYYTKLLKFKQVGPVRPCPRVNGTFGVLLLLNFAEIEAAVKGTGCTSGRDESGQRLHPYPYSETEEAEIAEFLARSRGPMSSGEARDLGLSPSFRLDACTAAGN